jgi:hypothetical protein
MKEKPVSDSISTQKYKQELAEGSHCESENVRIPGSSINVKKSKTCIRRDTQPFYKPKQYQDPWYDKPLGKILIKAIVGALGAAAAWVIEKISD